MLYVHLSSVSVQDVSSYLKIKTQQWIVSGTKCSVEIYEFTRLQCPLLASGRTADVAEMSSWRSMKGTETE